MIKALLFILGAAVIVAGEDSLDILIPGGK